MSPDNNYLWFFPDFQSSLWRFTCDQIRGMTRCQTTNASLPADTGTDVGPPKDKPRPPCEAVYKSISKPGLVPILVA